jgi:hypothetical protein
MHAMRARCSAEAHRTGASAQLPRRGDPNESQEIIVIRGLSLVADGEWVALHDGLPDGLVMASSGRVTGVRWVACAGSAAAVGLVRGQVPVKSWSMISAPVVMTGRSSRR